MIVVSNRIQVAKGHEEAFEKRFEGRARLVENHPGFIRLEILRPKAVQMHGKPLGGSDYYVVLTYWESPEAFEAWTEAEVLWRLGALLGVSDFAGRFDPAAVAGAAP